MSDTGITWLKPDQIEDMRDACYNGRFEKMHERDESIITLFADTGLRSSELASLQVGHFNPDERKLFLPVEIQKQYHHGEPEPATLGLKRDTVRTLRTYLKNRWKDSDYLFPSRQSEQVTTRSLRNLVTRIARDADVKPVTLDPERGWVDGEPDDVSTHTFRHSVAYRMLEVEEGYDIYDVMKRLRHKRIQTTIDTYSHFEAVYRV